MKKTTTKIVRNGKVKKYRNEETREKLSSIGKQSKRTKFYLYKNNISYTIYRILMTQMPFI